MEKVRQITSTLQMLITSLEPSRERSMVLRWKEEADLYAARRENRQKVLAAIEDGYDTLAEIIAETGIKKMTCYKVLRRLAAENSIQKTKVQNSNNRLELRFELTTKE